jgi:hypothetical protein
MRDKPGNKEGKRNAKTGESRPMLFQFQYHKKNARGINE